MLKTCNINEKLNSNGSCVAKTCQDDGYGCPTCNVNENLVYETDGTAFCEEKYKLLTDSELNDILTRLSKSGTFIIGGKTYYTIYHDTFSNLTYGNENAGYFYISYIVGENDLQANLYTVEKYHGSSWIFMTTYSVYINESATNSNYTDYDNEVFIGTDNSPYRYVNYDATVSERTSGLLKDSEYQRIYNANYMSFNPYLGYWVNSSAEMIAYKELYLLKKYVDSGFKIDINRIKDK